MTTTPDLAGSRREVLHIAWPIGVSMVSMTLKQLIDMLMVGQLGTGALAAVGLAGITAFNLLAFPIGLLRSQKPLVSQYLGAGERQTSISFGAQAFYIATLFGLGCLVLSFFSRSLSGFLTSATDMDAATVVQFGDYLGTRLLWSPPYLAAMAIAEYMRGSGRTRVPMAADLIAHPLNFLFNYALIFGNFGMPALGVEGAAIGTGLADCVSFLLLVTFAIPRRGADLPREALRWNKTRFLRALSVGSAGGIQFTLEVTSFALITYLIGSLGTVSLAAHQACISIVHVSWMPGMALGDGGAVLVGKYVGEQAWDTVSRTFRSTLSITMPLMLFLGMFFILFGEEMASLYLVNEDPVVRQEAIELGARVLVAAAFWQFWDALQIVFRFSLRAAGDHKWVMWVGVLNSWLISVPLVWAVVNWWGGSLDTVWWTWSAEIIVGTFIFTWRWRSGAWREKRLIRSEDSVVKAD